ncbi:MAG: hypothetical protein HZB59_11715 [Ignavibacteriales bacterium]|nr:hypothetical protein [Ignavibacteriales bacterium]
MKKKKMFQMIVLSIAIVMVTAISAATIIIADIVYQPVRVNTNVLPFCR